MDFMKIGLYVILAYVAVVYLLPMLGGGSGGGSGSLGGGAGTTMGNDGATPSDKPSTITEKIESVVSQTETAKGYPQYSTVEPSSGFSMSLDKARSISPSGSSGYTTMWTQGTNLMIGGSGTKTVGNSGNTSGYTTMWTKGTNLKLGGVGQESAGGGKNGAAQVAPTSAASSSASTSQSSNAPTPVASNQWGESSGGGTGITSRGKGGSVD